MIFLYKERKTDFIEMCQHPEFDFPQKKMFLRRLQSEPAEKTVC